MIPLSQQDDLLKISIRKMTSKDKQTTIYTIGYGDRSFKDFAEILKREGIAYLVDVRSQPYSNYQPDYSREQLAHKLDSLNIKYVFMGDLLGGRPKDIDCYTDGKVDYEKCQAKSFFKQGIDRVKDASRKGLRIVLMCSELKPQECHRSKLIGQVLEDEGFEIAHIDESGALMSQQGVIDRLLSGQQLSLLEPTKLVTTSRKRYIPRDK